MNFNIHYVHLKFKKKYMPREYILLNGFRKAKKIFTAGLQVPLIFLLELCKAVCLPVVGLLHLFSYPSMIFSSSSDMPTFQTIVIYSHF